MREIALYLFEHPNYQIGGAALLLLLGFWAARRGYLPGLAARLDPAPVPAIAGGVPLAAPMMAVAPPPTVTQPSPPAAGDIVQRLDSALDGAASLIATSDAVRAKLSAAAGQLAPPRPS